MNSQMYIFLSIASYASSCTTASPRSEPESTDRVSAIETTKQYFWNCPGIPGFVGELRSTQEHKRILTIQTGDKTLLIHPNSDSTQELFMMVLDQAVRFAMPICVRLDRAQRPVEQPEVSAIYLGQFAYQTEVTALEPRHNLDLSAKRASDWIINQDGSSEILLQSGELVLFEDLPVEAAHEILGSVCMGKLWVPPPDKSQMSSQSTPNQHQPVSQKMRDWLRQQCPNQPACQMMRKGLRRLRSDVHGSKY